jgi:hypothetical protein
VTASGGDEEPIDETWSLGAWIVIAVGAIMVGTALVAVFVVGGHDAPLTAALVIGAALVFAGVVLPRLKDDFEMGPSGIKGRLAQLRKQVAQAQEELPAEPVDEPSTGTEARVLRGSSLVVLDDIVAEVSRSPLTALLRMSRAVEHELRMLLEQTGYVSNNQAMSVMELANRAAERSIVPENLVQSIKVFMEVRNAMIHGHKSPTNAEVISAIDIGASILRMIDGIPRETHTILFANLSLYADEEGVTVVQEYTALVINSVSSGGVQSIDRVFPTTRTDYAPGQAVGWEWNTAHRVGPAWFKDPRDDEIKLAFSGSVEFVGRPLPPSPKI